MVTRSKPNNKLKKTYTIDEFMSLPDDGNHYELVAGKLIVMSPAGGPHGRIALNIGTELNIYLRKKSSGKAYGADTGFLIAPNTVRAPDAAFIAAGRLENEPLKGPMPLAPDLAVEVISPNDIYGEVDEKIEEYLHAGVRLIWVVNPRRHTVTIYRLDNPQITTLNINDELDGEDILPGFHLNLTTIFA